MTIQLKKSYAYGKRKRGSNLTTFFLESFDYASLTLVNTIGQFGATPANNLCNGISGVYSNNAFSPAITNHSNYNLAGQYSQGENLVLRVDANIKSGQNTVIRMKVGSPEFYYQFNVAGGTENWALINGIFTVRNGTLPNGTLKIGSGLANINNFEIYAMHDSGAGYNIQANVNGVDLGTPYLYSNWYNLAVGLNSQVGPTFSVPDTNLGIWRYEYLK